MVNSGELIVVDCEVSLSSILDDLVFDADYTAEVMRGRGMSEPAIADIPFHFRNLSPDRDGKHVTLGEHNPRTGAITSYIGSPYTLIAEGADMDLSEQVRRYAKKRRQNPQAVLTPEMTSLLDGMKTRRVEERLTHMANEALLHEIDHRVEAATTDPNDRTIRRIAYRERLDFRRQLKVGAITTAATVALAAPFVEVHYHASQSLIEKTLIGSMVVAGVLAIAGNIYSSKKPYGSLSHKEYLQSPWELEAREFSVQALQSRSTEVTDHLPLALRLKPMQFQFV